MTHTANRIMARNARGEWVPAIPLPFFGLRKRCECGRKFWTMDGYRGHFAFAHVMFPPGVPPTAGQLRVTREQS